MRGRSKGVMIALAVAGAALAPVVARAQHAHAEERGALPQIPDGLRREHREVHEELEWATKRPGRVGAAARALATVLHPHFVREEQVALPPLGLLAPLSRGERPANAGAVLPLTDTLRRELPGMLREHVAIREATRRLREVAVAGKDARAVRLADDLAAHATQEEEVTYPAALLVGALLRATGPHGAPDR
ncbi:MAG TPA: hemerythrin domain-containing protein [Gemmatimonadaceae bacterium]